VITVTNCSIFVLGVKLNGDGFKSEFAAKLAGENALRELLDGLAQEDKV